jgi:arylsulfatase A-like enzyme
VFQLSGEIVPARRDTTYVNVLQKHGYATALVGRALGSSDKAYSSDPPLGALMLASFGV